MTGTLPGVRVYPDIPGVTRGLDLPRAASQPTGWPGLDQALLGGWPMGALTELMSPESGIGELSVLLPVLRRLCLEGQRLVFIRPPHFPYAPALAQAGLSLSRIIWIEPSSDEDARWAAEQILREGAAAAVLLWSPVRSDRALRRLQLAASEGAALAFLYRPAAQFANPSPAALRLGLYAAPGGLRIEIAKARGGRPASQLLNLRQTAA